MIKKFEERGIEHKQAQAMALVIEHAFTVKYSGGEFDTSRVKQILQDAGFTAQQANGIREVFQEHVALR